MSKVGSEESGGVYERVMSKGPDSEVWMLKLRFASRPSRPLRDESSEQPQRLTLGVSWTVISHSANTSNAKAITPTQKSSTHPSHLDKNAIPQH